MATYNLTPDQIDRLEDVLGTLPMTLTEGWAESGYSTRLYASPNLSVEIRYGGAGGGTVILESHSPEVLVWAESYLGLLSEFSYLTPVEAAAMSGKAESTWRNRCARGEVPGAVKHGKQWLIPRTQVHNSE